MQIVRESLFISAIRAFINGLLAMIGVLIGFVILSAVLFNQAKPTANPEMNLTLEILPDADGSLTPLPETKPVILQLDIEGEIAMEYLTGDVIDTMLLASRGGIFKNDRVKAILLNINSPGGGALESDQIYSSLMRYKKKYNVPVFAYVNGLCASGGYYIACASDFIGASRLSIIGSVGVIMGPFMNYHGLTQKVGIDAVIITDGQNKVKIPKFSKLPEANEPKPWQDLIVAGQATYQTFLDVVINARTSSGMTEDMLRKIYGADVFISKTAMNNGYIDATDINREQMLTRLAEKAGITDGYQVFRYRYRTSFLEDLYKTNFVTKARSIVFGAMAAENKHPVSLYFDPSSL